MFGPFFYILVSLYLLNKNKYRTFAFEFISQLREGNRKTQDLILCVFCFYRTLSNRLLLYFDIILSRLLSFPVR